MNYDYMVAEHVNRVCMDTTSLFCCFACVSIGVGSSETRIGMRVSWHGIGMGTDPKIAWIRGCVRLSVTTAYMPHSASYPVCMTRKQFKTAYCPLAGDHDACFVFCMRSPRDITMLHFWSLFHRTTQLYTRPRRSLSLLYSTSIMPFKQLYHHI